MSVYCRSTSMSVSYVQEDQDHLAQLAALADRGELRPIWIACMATSFAR